MSETTLNDDLVIRVGSWTKGDVVKLIEEANFIPEKYLIKSIIKDIENLDHFPSKEEIKEMVNEHCMCDKPYEPTLTAEWKFSEVKDIIWHRWPELTEEEKHKLVGAVWERLETYDYKVVGFPTEDDIIKEGENCCEELFLI